jgi:hypothetical protein
MVITRETVRDRLVAYLNREISLAQLVDWAEDALCEGEMAEQDSALLSEILARLGAADIGEFGLTWEECASFLAQLGYQAQVKAIALAAEL